MRKIYILVSIFLSTAALAQEPAALESAAQEPAAQPAEQPMQQCPFQEASAQKSKKTWSFYGNVGIGYSTPVTLEGLSMTDADREYFEKRGVKPSFMTSGTGKVVPAFKLGASYYFNLFRASLEMGTQYVNQTNYHANNFSVDALFGFSPLKGNHEVNIDLGVGYYGLWNDYYYSWQGVDSNGNVLSVNGVPEQRTVYLGKHDVNAFSIPMKISYLYNIAGRHWLGAYVHGRYNVASEAFCPKFVVSGGIEYRFTLGRKRAKQPRPQSSACPYAMPVPVCEKKPAAAPAPVVVPCQSVMPVQQIPACPQMRMPKKVKNSGTINYNPVYSPVYIVVSPGTTVKFENQEGLRIEATATGKADTLAVSEPAPVAVHDTVYVEDNGSIRLLFEIGSAVITETTRGILDGISFEGVSAIEVMASTCAKGSQEANEKLGTLRTDAVKHYLRDRGYRGVFIEGYRPNEAPDPDWRSVFLKIKK